MKSTQNGARKDGGYSNSNTQNLQYSNMQNHNSSPEQAPGVLANYTLPGVISYLTSEFTSLERYKIMTNLEKSEMKYRIQQLTSELNSVRFINEKQALRIKHLEEKLENSTAVNPIEKKDLLKGDAVKDLTLDPKQEKTKNEEKQGNSIESNKNTDIAAGSTDIPHVDLEFLRNSRQKLNHSIREIVGLLDPPSAVDFLETHSNTASQSGLEDLLEDNKQFTFESGNDGRGKARESIFERYTLSKDDLLTGQKISFGNDSSKAEIPKDHQVLEQAPLVKPRPEPTSGAEESDTETVIMDESDLIGILANGAEKKKGSSV